MVESERVPWQWLDVGRSLVVGIDVREDLSRPYILFQPFPREVAPSVTFLKLPMPANVLNGMNVRNVNLAAPNMRQLSPI